MQIKIQGGRMGRKTSTLVTLKCSTTVIHVHVSRDGFRERGALGHLIGFWGPTQV